MHFGGDYNPEQWDESVWEDDIRLMQEAHVNLVSLGVFAWSRIQPDEGIFEFEWLDRVLALLHGAGISANLGTATASPPPWATRRYPDILPQDENGATYWPGSRQHYAPTSPSYRRLAADLVTELAARYRDHPAVVMWHVNNEYGCHLHYDYSDNATTAFRAWLRARYGHVDSLNAAWGTMFWSQRYASFDEIGVPRKAPYSHNPASLLDFRRFNSDALLELFRMEKSIIREAGATQPVTTNFMGAFQPVNYRTWANEVDVVADDSYPDPADPLAYQQAAFTSDLMRGLKPGTPWILMEQAPNAVNWRPNNAVKSPGQMAALSMQAVARGADGVMFFQWRQSMSGSEKFHSAMVPHAGTGSRTWHEVVALGSRLAELAPLPPLTQARVALMLDWENWWALDQPDHPVQIDYLDVVRSWHSAGLTAQIAVDIVGPDSDLSEYSVVLAPCLYLMTKETAANLIAHTEAGGTLVAGPFTDIVDENDRFRAGGFTTQLRDVLGLGVIEFDGIGARDLTVELNGRSHAARVVLERVHLSGAHAIASVAEEGLGLGPAVTMNRIGTGRAFYLATILDRAALTDLLDLVIRESGLPTPPDAAPVGVEWVRRGTTSVLINHSPSSVTLAAHDGLIELHPFEYRILRPPE